jgi:beta-carotene hydroxylase
VNRSRPIAEAAETLLSVIAIYYASYVCIREGYGYDWLTLWMLPLRIAIIILASTFDYVPHRPHKIQRHEDAYATTSRIEGIWRVGDYPLSVLLLYQNYHNIHHLFPSVPFYRYAPIWWRHRDELLKRGTPVVTMWKSDTPTAASDKKL